MTAVATGVPPRRRPWRTALQFALAGAVLFAAERLLLGPPRPLIAIDEDRLRRIAAEQERDFGTRPDGAALRRLAEQAADDEILWREATRRGLDRRDPSIAFRLTEKMRFVEDAEVPDETPVDMDLYRKALDLGFDRDDPVVRRIVLQKMRLLLAHRADADVPGEAELREHHRRRAERWRQPARIDATQVFLSTSGGTSREADARRLLERLRAGDVPPAEAAAAGDPFPLGSRLAGQSARDLARVYGESFGTRVVSLPVGSWEGPIESAQGLHLVRVDRREEGGVAPFETVRASVLADWRAERREARLDDELSRLRKLYEVRIDGVEGVTGSNGPN